MMLKVNGEYLDFNEEIDVERQVRLFQEIEDTAGDFSYAFNIPWTSKNIKALGFPLPDNKNKSVYQVNDAEILGDDGISIFRGSLRVEKPRPNINIQCSFFSGNSNWFSMLTGNMTSLKLSQYDVEQTELNIVDSWEQESGIVWPIIDTGTLITRSHEDLKTEDFTPAFYVKTLMFETFQQSGIKLSGELLQDWRYQHMIIAANGRSQEAIDNRSAYVLKTSTQAFPIPPAVPVLLTFEDDVNYPYFDGSQDNFNITLDRYTADIKMRLKVDLSMIIESDTPGTIFLRVYIRRSGTDYIVYPISIIAATQPFNKTIFINLDASDYVEAFIGTDLIIGNVNVTSATIRFTPTYLYQAFGNTSVPKWTKQEFVNNILTIFNVIPSYDSYNKTLTLNLFEKLKSKQPIDISKYVNIQEIDYTDLISNYARQNKFSYQESDIDNLKEYNVSEYLKYGVGSIECSNDFIQESVDVIESDFAAPISYINSVFDLSMERIQFVDFDTEESEITDVTTPGFSIARFGVADDIFEVNDLVRISESTNPAYNGDWLVTAVGANYIQCSGPVFDTDATAKIEKLIHRFTTEDSVYLFLNIPDYQISKASGLNLFNINSNFFFNASIAYFNLLNTDRQINIDFKQGLSFGEIENPLFYQRTILQDYWSEFGRILNDPVKVPVEANLPWKVHKDIDFLRPLLIKTLDTTNLYYLNFERGYKGSHIPCEMELIKLP